MGQSWFDLHQIFIGSLIVFAGVIAGLIGNGLLQRWDRSSRRDHDREVMRSALLAELTHLLNSYEYRVGEMSKMKGSFDIPIATETEVYDKLLDQIGVLKPEQGSKVIHAYLAAKHLCIDVGWIVKAVREAFEASTEPGPHEGMMRVPPWAITEALRLHRERIVLFKDAISALRA
jgi:hypothetical protein